QIDPVSETAAVLLVGPEVGGPGQSTPRQHRHQPLVAKRADQAIEGHRGDMADHRAPLQTEATMRRQAGITDHLRAHLTVTQDEVRQDGEHRFTRRTLYAPESETAQPDAHI